MSYSGSALGMKTPENTIFFRGLLWLRGYTTNDISRAYSKLGCYSARKLDPQSQGIPTG